MNTGHNNEMQKISWDLELNQSRSNQPGWAPSSITWSLDVSCPAVIDFVENAISRDGESFPATWAHHKVSINMRSKKWHKPGRAPSPITNNFETSWPPTNVLVAKEMRREGLSYPGTCRTHATARKLIAAHSKKDKQWQLMRQQYFAVTN